MNSANSHRLSRLQRRILQTLSEAPIGTQAALAKRVNSHQPSVSRSINVLIDHHMVERFDGGYRLTAKGEIINISVHKFESHVAKTSDAIAVELLIASASLREAASMIDELASEIQSMA